jgi:thiaminase/transcriptional activator TenA
MFFTELEKEVDSILQSIYQLPFIQELAQGTLDEEIFSFYLRQDQLYLNEFGRSLALAGGRLTNNQSAICYMEFALGALKAEQDLHKNYLSRFKSPVIQTKPSSSCFAYTNFLIKSALYDPVEVSLAALLPCFWVYQKVGEKLIEKAKTSNPYYEWINLYGGHDFKQSTEQAIRITNELAMPLNSQQRQAMFKAFIYSTQYELIFWESVFEQQEWSV